MSVLNLCNLYGNVYSYTSHQQSYISYSSVTIYSSMSECCSGYVGVPPDCQGN